LDRWRLRASPGRAIRLLPNDWNKAHHVGEKYRLYVVTEMGSDGPELHRI